jgi:hypothetical protein
VNPTVSHARISELREGARRRRPRIAQNRLFSAALGLVELCELAAPGLAPTTTPVASQSHANESIRNQQQAARRVENAHRVHAGSAAG